MNTSTKAKKSPLISFGKFSIIFLMVGLLAHSFDVKAQQNLYDYNDFTPYEKLRCDLATEAMEKIVKVMESLSPYDQMTLGLTYAKSIENSDNENEYMKSILPKQKSYVIRFSLLLEVLDSYDKDFNTYFEITKKSILSAEKLSDYFILMAKKNKVDSLENKEIKDTIKKSGKTSSKDKFISILESGAKINKSKIAIELNISRVTLNKWENEYNISSVSK